MLNEDGGNLNSAFLQIKLKSVYTKKIVTSKFWFVSINYFFMPLRIYELIYIICNNLLSYNLLSSSNCPNFGHWEPILDSFYPICPLYLGKSCVASSVCGVPGSGTRMYPWCTICLFGVHSLW